jgi:hypothetical protein
MRGVVSSALVLILGIMLYSCASSPKETRELKTGTLSGQIMIKGGGPMSGGTVFFFNEKSGPPPSATRYWRVPTDAFKVDDIGKFIAVLPTGEYYMGASKKLSGELLGPPQEGDLFFISQDAKGNPKLHTVAAGEVVDLGVISEAVPFSRKMLETKGITSIEGTIRDTKGDPVKGILVFAFSAPTMVGRPLFVSDRSDNDGKYLLRLYGGGTYYLRARVNYGGGPPSADQVMGIYGDGQPLTIKTGEVKKDTDIKMITIGDAR